MSTDTITPATRPISEATLRKWFDRLQAVARERYTRGWDHIVECVGFEDFKRHAAQHNITSRKAMWALYRATVSDRWERAADIQAEAD